MPTVQTPDIDVAKAVTKVNEDGTCTFTVTVTSKNGTNTNIHIHDTLGAFLTIDPLKITKTSGYEYTQADVVTSKGFDVYVKEMAKGKTIKITYQAKLDLDSAQEAYTSTEGKAGRTNTVIVEHDGCPASTKHQKTATVEITDFGISKNGVAEVIDGTTYIHWTVYVNDSANFIYDMSGSTIYDHVTEPDYQTPVEGTLKVYEYTGSGASKVLGSEVTNVGTFKLIDNKSEGEVGFEGNFNSNAGRKKYAFKYDTKVADGVSVAGNTAGGTVPRYTKAIEAKSSVKLYSDENYNIKKICVNPETKAEYTDASTDTTVMWIVDVEVPSRGANGCYFDDNIPNTMKVDTSYTPTIERTSGTGDTPKLTWNNSYTTFYLNAGSITPEGTYRIKYQTIVKDPTTTKSFTNSAWLHDDYHPSGDNISTASATYNYAPANFIVLKKGSSKDEAETGSIFWTIQLNQIPYDSDTYKVTDTLSMALYKDGAETATPVTELVEKDARGNERVCDKPAYVPGSLVAMRNTGTAEETTLFSISDDCVDTTTVPGSIIITLNDEVRQEAAKADKLELRYRTTVDQPYDGQKVDYTNTVYMTQEFADTTKEPKDYEKRSSDPVPITKAVVIQKSKDYTAKTTPYVYYTSVVNPSGATLPVEGDGNLTFKDIFESDLDLLMDSVKLDGETVDYKYDADKRQITIDGLSNSEVHTVTYTMKVNVAVGSDLNNSYNTAEVYGEDSEGNESRLGLSYIGLPAKAIGSGGEVHADGWTLYVQKLANDERGVGTGTTLNHAFFNVAPVSTGTVLKTEETSGTGQAKFSAMADDTLYALSESDAPFGYLKDENTYLFFSKSSDDVDITSIDSNVYEAEGAYWRMYRGKARKITIVDASKTSYTQTVYDTPETIEIPVSKTWDDNDDQDGYRSTVTAHLYYADAQGNKTTEVLYDNKPVTLTLTKANDWKGTFKQLRKYSATADATGNYPELYYTVEEELESNSDKYEKSVSGNQTDGFTFTNKHTPETTSINVRKDWQDNDDQDGKRQTVSVTLTGKAGTKVVYTDDQDLTEDDKDVTGQYSWYHEWTDLPVYSNGTKIEYSLKENTNIAGYTMTVSGDAETGFVVTNTLTTPETTQVKVTKIWDDESDRDHVRPASIWVKLSNDKGLTIEGDTVELSSAKNQEASNADWWSHTWTNLQKKYAGQTVTYTVDEVDANGNVLQKLDKYDSKEVSADTDRTDAFAYTITNKRTPEKVNVNVLKIWEDEKDQDGYRPEYIEAELYADNVATGKKVKLSEDNQWTDSWTGLYKFNADKSGNEIVYTVKEVAGKWSDYYTTVIPEPGFDETTNTYSFEITNTHTTDNVNFVAMKEWQDDNNRDGIQPDSITVVLKSDAAAAGTMATVSDAEKELNSTNQWYCSWDNQPAKTAGRTINYEVSEVQVNGYELLNGEPEVMVDGNTTIYKFTNKHEPELVPISGYKYWNDNKDQDGKRPTFVKLRLLNTNDPTQDYEIAVKTLTLADATVDTTGTEDNWSYTFPSQKKYFLNKETGKAEEVQYKVEEILPDGSVYTAESVENDPLSVRNTYSPETTRVSAEKTWENTDGYDGPEMNASITLTARADGKVISDVTTDPMTKDLTVGTNESVAWENLPVYRDKQKITYNVTEEISMKQSDLYEAVTALNDDGHKRVEIYRRGVDATSKDSLILIGIWDCIRTIDDNGGYHFENTWYRGDNVFRFDLGKYEEVDGQYQLITGEDEEVAATFELYKENADGSRELYRTLHTDGTGMLSSNGVDDYDEYLPEGTYYLKETEAPESFIITEEEMKLVLDVKQGQQSLKVVKSDLTVFGWIKYWFTRLFIDKDFSGSVHYKAAADGSIMVIDTPVKGKISITKAAVATAADAQGDVSLKQEAKIREFHIKGLGTKNASVDQDIELVPEKDGTYATVTLENLPYGKYQITEITDGADHGTVTGYSWIDYWFSDASKDGDYNATIELNEDNREVNILVGSDRKATKNDADVSFEATNRWTRDKGSIKITKKLTGDKVDLEKLQRMEFDIEQVKPEFEDKQENHDGFENGFVKSVFFKDFTEENGTYTYTLNDIPTGTYKVTEFGAGPDFYTWTMKVDGREVNSDDNEYITSDDQSFTKGQTITFAFENDYKVDRTEHSVDKFWDDDSNRDGIRPADLKVELKAATGSDAEEYVANVDFDANNYETVKAGVVLKASDSDASRDGYNDWTYMWENLPVADISGNVITYWVEESLESGEYVLDWQEEGEMGTFISNHHKPYTTTYSVEKVWDDDENRDGVRPEGIWAELHQVIDGEDTLVNEEVLGSEENPVLLNESNNWKYTWNGMSDLETGAGLPVYAPGKVGVPVYYYAIEKVAAEDNGTTTPDFYVASGSDAGMKQATPANATEEGGFQQTITNKHEIWKTSYKVTKNWIDSKDNHTSRPAKLDVTLYAEHANGEREAVDTQTLSSSNDWTYEWKDLNRYEMIDGETFEIEYSVDEEGVIGYRQLSNVTEVAYENQAAPKYVEASEQYADKTYDTTLTNRQVIGSLSIHKQPDGNAFDENKEFKFTVTFDKSFSGSYPTVTSDEDGTEIARGEAEVKGGVTTVYVKGGQTIVITDLPEGLKYTVEEAKETADDESYETGSFENEGAIIGGTTKYVMFVNRKNRTAVSVQKKWVGDTLHQNDRPEGINVQLWKVVKRDGEIISREKYGDVVTLNESNGWAYDWTDLPTDVATASNATKANAAYASVSTAANASDTNAYNTWVDKTASPASAYNASANNASPSIAIYDDETGELLDGDVFNDIFDAIIDVVSDLVDAVSGETTEFLGIDTTQKITWEVEELDWSKDGKGLGYLYTTNCEKLDAEDEVGNAWIITNTYTRNLRGFEVTKIWEDSSNSRKKRPTSIEVTLYRSVAGGEKEAVETVTLSEENQWTYNWDKLETANDDDLAYDYTVAEAAVSYYTASYAYTQDDYGVTVSALITNRYHGGGGGNGGGGGGNGGGGGGKRTHDNPPSDNPPTNPPKDIRGVESAGKYPTAVQAAGRLPKTGEDAAKLALAAFAAFAGMITLFGFGRKKDEEN